jgi:acetyltransferase-like isoleucine patch superfamily enzyme
VGGIADAIFEITAAEMTSAFMYRITASIAERRLSSSSAGSVSPTGGVGKSINILVDLEEGTRITAREVGRALSNAIGPSAVVPATARIGRGVAMLRHISTISPSFGTSINHDCQVGEGTHIAPGATIAANVRIGGLAFIGIGSCRNSRHHNWGRRRAGAWVVRDIPPRPLAIGFRHAWCGSDSGQRARRDN